MDAYFLWEHRNDYFADVYERYRERAVAASFQVDVGKREETRGRLDHLTSHYYRFYLDQQVATCQVTLEAERQDGSSPQLKAALAEVTDVGRREVKTFQCKTLQQAPGWVQLSAELSPGDGKVDHLVLVIINCGTRAQQSDPHISHDDEQNYKVIIETS